MNKISDLLATIFGVGYLPLAPGTWCSAVAVITWFFLYPFATQLYLFFITIVIFLIGVAVSKQFVIRTGKKDPSEVVIDEWAGQWIALIYIPHSVHFAIAAFILFRILDIIKPFSISELEKYPNGWGVMLDDAAAGLISCGLIHTFIYFS